MPSFLDSLYGDGSDYGQDPNLMAGMGDDPSLIQDYGQDPNLMAGMGPDSDPSQDPLFADNNRYFPPTSGGQIVPGQTPMGSAAIAAAIGKDPSILSKLFSNNPQGMANLASVLGSFSSGQKANRLMQGNFTQNYDRNAIAAQTARNQNESDALHKLAQTGYIKGGGANFAPPTFQLNGKTVTAPSFSFAPRNSSQAQITGANTLEAQLLDRLKPGGSYTPQPLDSYATPGAAENIGSYGATVAGGLGAADTILRPTTPQGGYGGPTPPQQGGPNFSSVLGGVNSGMNTYNNINNLGSSLGWW